MSAGFCDHFAGVATHYASHRPGYPDALFSWLASQLAGRRLAWDCATSRYREQVGVNPVTELTELLAPLWGAALRRVSWPRSLKVGRLKP